MAWGNTLPQEFLAAVSLLKTLGHVPLPNVQKASYIVNRKGPRLCPYACPVVIPGSMTCAPYLVWGRPHYFAGTGQ